MKSESVNEQAVTWASEAHRKKDMRRQRWVNLKSSLAMWWHGAYWATLHAFGLGRPYSIAMCKAGLYRKFPDGRCMWCGVCH